MVDTTASLTNPTKSMLAAQDRKNQLDSSVAHLYSNMMSLIKLRQKGTTMVSMLPKDVFRYVLEYQSPNELSWRYSAYFGNYMEEETSFELYQEKRFIKNADKHFPDIDKLDYENYLVEIK